MSAPKGISAPYFFCFCFFFATVACLYGVGKAKVLFVQKELVVRYTELNTLFTAVNTRACCSQCSIRHETDTFRTCLVFHFLLLSYIKFHQNNTSQALVNGPNGFICFSPSLPLSCTSKTSCGLSAHTHPALTSHTISQSSRHDGRLKVARPPHLSHRHLPWLRPHHPQTHRSTRSKSNTTSLHHLRMLTHIAALSSDTRKDRAGPSAPFQTSQCRNANRQ